MPEVGERLDKVEQRLGAVENRVGAVETGLKEVRAEVGGLRREVNGLRVLGEKNTEDIKKIAEVQSHHGEKLDEIAKAVAPIEEIRDFIRRVAPDHEHRIHELEKHPGIRP